MTFLPFLLKVFLFPLFVPVCVGTSLSAACYAAASWALRDFPDNRHPFLPPELSLTTTETIRWRNARGNLLCPLCLGHWFLFLLFDGEEGFATSTGPLFLVIFFSRRMRIIFPSLSHFPILFFTPWPSQSAASCISTHPRRAFGLLPFSESCFPPKAFFQVLPLSSQNHFANCKIVFSRVASDPWPDSPLRRSLFRTLTQRWWSHSFPHATFPLLNTPVCVTPAFFVACVKVHPSRACSHCFHISFSCYPFPLSSPRISHFVTPVDDDASRICFLTPSLTLSSALLSIVTICELIFGSSSSWCVRRTSPSPLPPNPAGPRFILLFFL